MIRFAIAVAVCTARAAQADCVTLDRAQVASAIKLVKDRNLLAYCQPCGDPEATMAQVHAPDSVSIKASKDALLIENKPFDLLRLYIQTGATTFTNVGYAVGCSELGVDGFLDLRKGDISYPSRAERSREQVAAQRALTVQLEHARRALRDATTVPEKRLAKQQVDAIEQQLVAVRDRWNALQQPCEP